MSRTALARIERELVPTLRRDQPAPAYDESLRSAAAGSDRDLIEAVKSALSATGHAPLRHVDIELCRGVVVLWGRVPTYYQKQYAQVTAQQVDGVRGVANGLEVVCNRRGTSHCDLP